MGLAPHFRVVIKGEIMSADNGYIVRVHPKGGFCLVGYSMSCQMEDMYETPDGYPLAEGREEQFPSIQAALTVDQDYMGSGYWSEYGISLDAECENIRKALTCELHMEITRWVTPNSPLPNWDTSARCSCGYETRSRAELWKHQADALREQLKQLGG